MRFKFAETLFMNFLKLFLSLHRGRGDILQIIRSENLYILRGVFIATFRKGWYMPQFYRHHVYIYYEVMLPVLVVEKYMKMWVLSLLETLKQN